MRNASTKRFRLELLAPGHRRALVKFSRANRALFEQFNEALGDDAYTDEGLRFAFDASIRDAAEGLACTLVLADERGSIWGQATLHRFAPFTSPLELTYQTDHGGRGLGIATCLVRALIELAARDSGVHVDATTTCDNGPSIRVLQKLGFRRMGEAEDAVLRCGIVPCARYVWGSARS
ncbi:MAG: GNAT family protein [Variovorax sp.]